MEEKMEIRKLTPDLCEDWLAYFDGIAFQDHGEWAFCYCLEGYLDRKTQEEWVDPKMRRSKAAEMIRTGVMQGYLVYSGDQVIGWCNVNDRENYRYLTEMFREIGYQPQEEPGTRVKAVFCFLVAPQHRGQGIAGRLLNRICTDAAADGYDCVEAYPFADAGLAYQYHGTEGMYLKNGFTEKADLGFVKVMRKRMEINRG